MSMTDRADDRKAWRRDMLRDGAQIGTSAQFGSAGGRPTQAPVLSPGRPALLLLSAALLSLAACGDDPVFSTLFTTEHFVFHVEEGATLPCDGVAQWLERYYSANAKFLGATLPPGERIEYY